MFVYIYIHCILSRCVNDISCIFDKLQLFLFVLLIADRVTLNSLRLYARQLAFVIF